MWGRGLIIAAVAAFVVAFIAAPGGRVGRASGDPAGGATGPQSVIYGGPLGRTPIDGPWILRGDKLDHGIAKGWPAGSFSGSTVTTPFSPNAKRVTGAAGLVSFRGSIGWYRTTISVPSDGVYAIHFESVNHRATVWVDGRAAAEHVGTYLPFDADVRLTAGTHALVVRADWRNPAQMKREAWHRTWFNFGGINREVSIRPLGPSDISAPSIRTRLLPGGGAAVDVAIHLRNRVAARQLAAEGVLEHDGRRYPFRFPRLLVAQDQTVVASATVKVPDPALWSPGSPALYDVGLSVPGEAAYRLRTGLRELRKAGSRLLLNGRPITLRGASLHEDAEGRGDALTPADMDRLVGELKAVGANATRAQHPLNPALLERLDAAGIMVWMGVGPVDGPGAWTSKTPRLRLQSENRVRASLFQLQTHPSIIAWNLANEVAGNGHPGGQASYLSQMAAELHRRDPGRLVALDVWGAHPPKVAGPLYANIDAIGDTNYIGWYEDTLSPKRVVNLAIRRHEQQMRRTFPGKILVVTEFGAEANSENPTARPGGYAFQSDLLRRHIEIYKTLPGLSGMLVWNIRDFAVSPAFAGGSINQQVPGIKLVRGLNQKGLFHYDGTPKPAMAVVRKALAAAP